MGVIHLLKKGKERTKESCRVGRRRGLSPDIVFTSGLLIRARRIEALVKCVFRIGRLLFATHTHTHRDARSSGDCALIFLTPFYIIK